MESDKYFDQAKLLHEETPTKEGNSIFLDVSEFVIQSHISDFADRALARVAIKIIHNTIAHIVYLLRKYYIMEIVSNHIYCLVD